MFNAKLRAEDPLSGEVVGWRKHTRIVASGSGRITIYVSRGAALEGLESAERCWPQYTWRAFDHEGQECVLERRPKQAFTREEVWALVLKERMGCANASDFDFGRGAREIVLQGRPQTLEGLECETNPSTR